MSELISTKAETVTKRFLLSGVSVLALAAAFPKATMAADHPTVWIEVGSQLDRLADQQEAFAPPFVSALLANAFTPPSVAQKDPLYSFGQEARITFAPEGSDWIFSAALQYGRANSSGNTHEETSPKSAHSLISIPVLEKYGTAAFPAQTKRFATTAAQTHSTDFVLDFQAGRDVGLGLFGSRGTSTLSAGVRFAQFTSRSKVRIDSDPDFVFGYKYLTSIVGYPADVKIPLESWDLYNGKMNVARSFHGMGPSLSWDANAALVGDERSGVFSLDWGLNAALLFGRQKAQIQHVTMAHQDAAHNANGIPSAALPTLYPTKVHTQARSHSAVVPNVGGFAGFSLRFPNAKVSIGYRVDAYFGAMDGGIDTRKSYDRDFYGPFATIAIGLGG